MHSKKANLKIASLQQSLDSSRAVEEAMGRKLAATEALLADSARTSAKELEKRLNEALKVETADEMHVLLTTKGGREDKPVARNSF